MSNDCSPLRQRPADWRLKRGFGRRKIVVELSSIVMTEYELPAPGPLRGRKLAFFSDLHWDGNQQLGDELLELFHAADADWVLFGGDLVCYYCHLRPAFDLLAKIQAKEAKIAALGNWDVRNRSWFPHAIMRREHERAGFRLLVNESFDVGPLRFVGLRPFSSNLDKLVAALHDLPPAAFTCLLSHFPERVLKSFDDDFMRDIDLTLCGHTHGGQVRVPYFGALRTSSCFWKKFEYGHYVNRVSGANMIVSNGVGCTMFKLRLFCKPEVVVVKFT